MTLFGSGENMSYKNWLHLYVNRASFWLIERLEDLARQWLESVQKSETPLYEYIEAMLDHYVEVRQGWQETEASSTQILLYSIPIGSQIMIGIVRLSLPVLGRVLSLLFWAVDEQWAIADAVGTAPAFQGLAPRPVIQFLHRITGDVGRRSQKVKLTLNSQMQILSWDEGSENVFGFHASEAIGRNAIGTFIPPIETGGRNLSLHIQEVCSSPERFRLNINENCDADGHRFWMLWVNVSISNADSNGASVFCVGIKTQDQELIKQFFKHWQF